MKQTQCKLCGAPFVCDNGMWFTTCTCAKDKPAELAVALGEPSPLNQGSPSATEIVERFSLWQTSIQEPMPDGLMDAVQSLLGEARIAQLLSDAEQADPVPKNEKAWQYDEPPEET